MAAHTGTGLTDPSVLSLQLDKLMKPNNYQNWCWLIFCWAANPRLVSVSLHTLSHVRRLHEHGPGSEIFTHTSCLHNEMTMYHGGLTTCQINWSEFESIVEAQFAWQQRTVMIFHDVWMVINFTFLLPCSHSLHSYVPPHTPPFLFNHVAFCLCVWLTLHLLGSSQWTELCEVTIGESDRDA